ncbi:MAG: ABC transporter substrate-binding protein [Proteobacteria bacterium]|nr:ABC transporter substrate-binding protein [Pseudomonadota bacterium]MBS0574343.1 ABC transporter substrate-binding protein [Pseudomonadota bacterium]
MKAPFTGGLARILMAAALAAMPAAGFAANADETIKLTVINSSDTDVPTYILGHVLQKAGFNVDYVSADYTAGLTGLKQGDLHTFFCWDTTWDACQEAVASGSVINAGSSGIAVHEGWWYPKYLEQSCPGLPDYKALLQEGCVKALATAETEPKAQFVGAPADWTTYVDETIDAFGLQFQPITSGSSGALIATLKGAYDRKEPIMGWGYSPHWFFDKADGGFVQFPDYEPACFTDPKWGPVPDKTHDCKTPSGFLWKLMNRDISLKAPAAARILYLFTLDAKTVADGMEKIDVKGESYDKMAEDWVNANESVWRAWLK